jgi:hypothetical protein
MVLAGSLIVVAAAFAGSAFFGAYRLLRTQA